MNYYKALLAIVFWLVFSSSIACAEKTYIISGNSHAPPVVWAEQSRLSGVGPDLVSKIFDELSIPYEVRVIDDWSKVQQEAEAGTIDLIVSAFRNKQREGYLNFSIPYLPEPSVVLVRKGTEFEFSKWSALKGKKGVAGSGESFGQEFDAFLRDNLDVSFFTLERAVQELALGKADYLIIDYYTALIYTYLLQGEQAVTILEPSIGTENFHLAIAKNSPLSGRLADINRVLAEQIAGGVVTELFMTHYERWERILEQQSEFFGKLAAERTAEQRSYLEEQGELARQSIIKLMVDREGLPAAAR
jgi:polar amino acid transport system substrate-binding protein